jgi:RNA polymerase sigma factor (sigma-70 family)
MERIKLVQSAPEFRTLNAESPGRAWLASSASSPDADASWLETIPCSGCEVQRDGELFVSHRSRLLGIAHRMLGSRSEAEDLVQDVYLRWHQSMKAGIKSPIGFLVTITTRLCLDRLRELKRQRVEYIDVEMSENVEDHMPSPETQLSFSQDVSMAFLTVLERLGPEERAAFLLHDVLDYDYHEMAKMLRKTESACRQMIHRARTRLRDSRPRSAHARKCCESTVKKFLAAIGSGDREAVVALLAEDVEGMALWINTHFLFGRGDGTLERRTANDRSTLSLHNAS